MTQSPLPPTTISIPELRAGLRGQVILPGEGGYDPARAVFYGGFDRRPAAIVRPAGTDDIARVLAYARRSGAALAVRSGGHSVAGHSVCEGGIVLDLRQMKALEIDAGQRLAWAETGLTAGEYTAAAGEYGLATGFGDTGSVGIGGITLGGGVGYLVRKYGLTIDSLLAAEIMTADGQLLYVDTHSHPDLFWAMRGGGGNFGVATRFKFQLHEVGPVVGGMLFLPAAPETIAAFMAAAEAAPEELSGILNVMPAPPAPFVPPELVGQLVLLALLVYTGEAEAGQRALAPFRALAQPLADLLRPMRYPEMFPPEEAGYTPTAVSHTMFVERIDVPAAETILRFLQASDAPMRVAQLRVLGGAMARVPVEETAFAHRKAPIMVNLAAFYTGPQDRPARQAWLDDFRGALQQGNSGVYVNFLEESGPAGVQAAYPGETWSR
ncbi:MAG: FAD-binding oxidoreductase, partial [Chloroflexi bacterium]|nr:FAD-binding oxidoreductase [Chloroflexota bacterium]